MNTRLIAVAPNTLEWREVDVPQPGPRDLLVRTHFGAIKHGTEFAMFRGNAAARGPWDNRLQLHDRTQGASEFTEFALGNMVAGCVEAVGEAVNDASQKQFAAGDLVYGYAPLGEQVIFNSRRAWHLPDLNGWKSAVCLDPARFALGALRDGDVRVGDVVVVFGLGAIGLVAVQLARSAGAAAVFGVDPVARRREAARSVGADTAFDPAMDDLGRELKNVTETRGVDVALDFSGSVGALQQALRGLAFGGTLVCGAFPAPYPAGLDFGAEAHMNRPRIVFSRAVSDPNRDHPRWNAGRIEEVCAELIANGAIQGGPIVDRVVPFTDLQDAFPEAMSDPEWVTKLGVRFAADPEGGAR